MKHKMLVLIVMTMAVIPTAYTRADHFDVAPYLVGGELLTGGLDHEGHVTAPSITAYGFDFGEDPYDPFNPSDPGVNQAAGTGDLPAGAALSYNIRSSLLYWDGSGEVNFTTPGDAYISLLMGTQARTIDADSGDQNGAYIQAVLSDGSLHKHFTTSLYAEPEAGNVPDIGDPTYLEPDVGIYAFSIELILNDSGTVYTSDPLWMVFNNGLDETAHDAAMAYLAPEPASLSLLAMGGVMLMRLRKKR